MRVRRVASGWETEFGIGMDSMLSPVALKEDIEAFYQVADQTRLRIVQEALSGSWEALLDRRVDLLIGAAGEGPSGGGYKAEMIGTVRFLFAVAPSHPLAAIDRPLRKDDLRRYRAISVADSVRQTPARTVGLLLGQETLTVPDMQTKYRFQLAGLGFGFLPEACVHEALATGALVVKEVDEPRPEEPFYLAWRTGEEGAALKWWLDRARQYVAPERFVRLVPPCYRGFGLTAKLPACGQSGSISSCPAVCARPHVPLRPAVQLAGCHDSAA
jgi:DNA-binding transcriptional LysR family regulator